jgi:chain length determinant protein (polysaccharide antigen chain regulator)
MTLKNIIHIFIKPFNQLIMTTEKKETPPEQSMPQFNPQYYGPAEDEVNLLDLWQVLVKRWWLIFIVSIVSVVMAVAYVLTLPKIYQVEAHILQVEIGDLPRYPEAEDAQRLQSINIFEQVKRNFNSSAIQREFIASGKMIKKSELKSGVEMDSKQLFNLFENSLRLKDNGGGQYILSLKGFDQEQIAGILNRYLSFISERTKAAIIDEIEGDLKYIKHVLESDIQTRRTMAFHRKEDKLFRLRESLAIAMALNIENSLSFPQEITNVSTFSQAQEANDLRFNLGTKVLKAQIRALELRKSDDPYISGIRGLQGKLLMIDVKLRTFDKSFSVMRFDKKASRPDFPIKINKREIVAVGGVLGLILGVFAAFFFNFVENNSKEEGAEG